MLISTILTNVTVDFKHFADANCFRFFTAATGAHADPAGEEMICRAGTLKRKARKLTDLRAEISLSHWTYTFLI